MRPYAAAARYVNYLGDDETDNAAEAAYGPNLPRLRTIKAKYDPQNVFRQNHNIPPA
jgi:FAD/FMN-containing dehydrogenase